MGLFDKFKEKIASAVQSTTDALGFNKIQKGLEKTRSNFFQKIQGVLGIGRKIDQSLLNDIEDILISADIGVRSSEKIITALKERIKKEGFENSEDIFLILKEEILKLLIESPSANVDREYKIDESNKPHTILIIGVNGVGKTTTIGKLAFNYRHAGKNVLIGAADTFRAAANEQLEIWAERAGVPIVQQKQGADPASVAYDTLNSAISKGYDVVIIDTAGRLHNKANLMAELEKISRVMKKLKTNAPDDVMLVLDATTGQNAIQQAKEFSKVANITGIVLTKLDGTAKGGVVIPIADELRIPVRYIGVGEKIDDLQVFDPVLFVEALFQNNEKNKNQ
jgi:fused signal recognition particle receptor